MYSLNYKKEKVMKIKENKKKYFQPEAEVVEVEIKEHLMIGSAESEDDPME